MIKGFLVWFYWILYFHAIRKAENDAQHIAKYVLCKHYISNSFMWKYYFRYIRAMMPVDFLSRNSFSVQQCFEEKKLRSTLKNRCKGSMNHQRHFHKKEMEIDLSLLWDSVKKFIGWECNASVETHEGSWDLKCQHHAFDLPKCTLLQCLPPNDRLAIVISLHLSSSRLLFEVYGFWSLFPGGVATRN